MKPFKLRILDVAAVVVVAIFVVLGLRLLQNPTWMNIILLIILGYSILRIIYEFTIDRHGVPTLAANIFVQRKIAGLLADMKPRVVIDMGSGRGELTRTIARALPQSHVVGIELDRIPHRQASLLARMLRLKNLEYRGQDFWSYDCSGADAVVMFLSGKLTKELGDKLRTELKPGAHVITYQFELLGAWAPIATVTMHTPFLSTLYVYKR